MSEISESFVFVLTFFLIPVSGFFFVAAAAVVVVVFINPILPIQLLQVIGTVDMEWIVGKESNLNVIDGPLSSAFAIIHRRPNDRSIIDPHITIVHGFPQLFHFRCFRKTAVAVLIAAEVVESNCRRSVSIRVGVGRYLQVLDK
jgi:hypothetical protein